MTNDDKYTILIVDDSPMNRSILSDILGEKYNIFEAEDGVQAIKMIKKYDRKLDLILLDLVMPNMDGLEVLATMNQGEWIGDIPVIIISSETSPSYVERAYELGATDFINRPFNVTVVKKRVANTILLYAKQKGLINLVSQQMYEKEKNNQLMINILSHIVEFRNGESGLHILHVNTITEALLNQLVKKTDKYNLTYDNISAITTASSLHDIGKISIPDEILNKPGKLTEEEFEIMKGHSKAGADMLETMTEYISDPLVRTAHDICLYHHERYDGKGYPFGISGDDIPISAQVVAIADVYDALTSQRCYKDAVPHSKAIDMIKNGECGAFNPTLLVCLDEISDFLEREIKINSASARSKREIEKIVMEMQRQDKLSATGKSINILEQARIKYEFYAYMTQEIQFEYMVSPSLLYISEWCANKLGLPSLIANPLKNEKFLNLLCGSDTLDIFRKEMKKTTNENPITQFKIKLNLDGEPRLHKVYCRVTHSNDDENVIVSAIGKVVDIEDEHQKLAGLRKKARIDTLTNIYNKGYSVELVSRILAENIDKNYALVLFDLDNFKSANDNYGHMFGDNVLKIVAKQLADSTRKEDVIARIGGDEFLLFFEYKNKEILESVTQRIYTTINNLTVDSYKVDLCMGVVTTEQVGYDYDTLFNCADSALYHSKRNGKASYNFYNKDMKLIKSDMTPIEN